MGHNKNLNMEYGIINTDGQLIVSQAKPEEGVWKPIEELDLSRMESGDPDYIIMPTLYDDGDMIRYQYNKVFDTQRILSRINQLKETLESTDYKVIKCYEASLVGDELPYDINELHAERQAQRDIINELQKKLEHK